MAAPVTDPAPPADRHRDLTDLLRVGVLALAGIGTLGAAYELAVERHWGGLAKNVPWLAVVALAVAVGTAFAARAGSPRLVLVTRVLAVLVLGASVYGIAMHVLENMHSGHLGPRYGPEYKQLPRIERLWLGMTKTVGDAPPLAPGMLGQSALLVLLGTLGRRPGR
ncbi:MAG: hypothetical protein ACT4RN_03180 [Pseudonocardia sp.]